LLKGSIVNEPFMPDRPRIKGPMRIVQSGGETPGDNARGGLKGILQ